MTSHGLVERLYGTGLPLLKDDNDDEIKRGDVLLRFNVQLPQESLFFDKNDAEKANLKKAFGE